MRKALDTLMVLAAIGVIVFVIGYNIGLVLMHALFWINGIE